MAYENPKYSYNDIPNYQTDWEKDTTNENKQFSGKSVQKFIKRELQASLRKEKDNDPASLLT